MSYSEILGANNTLVYPDSGGGGSQNLQQVLTVGPSAAGLTITNLAAITNTAGPLQLTTNAEGRFRSTLGNVFVDADADTAFAQVVAGTTQAAQSSLTCTAGAKSVVKGAIGADFVAVAGDVLVNSEVGTSITTVRGGTSGAAGSEVKLTGQGACEIKGANGASFVATTGNALIDSLAAGSNVRLEAGGAGATQSSAQVTQNGACALIGAAGLTATATTGSMVLASTAADIQLAGSGVCIAAAAAAPNASAILDLVSTTKALIVPRVTTTQKNAIANPIAGMVVYDITLGKLSVRTGTVWQTVQAVDP